MVTLKSQRGVAVEGRGITVSMTGTPPATEGDLRVEDRVAFPAVEVPASEIVRVERGRRSDVRRSAVLVGGGLEDENEEIYGALLAMARRGLPDDGTQRPRIAVLPSSKASLAAGEEVYFEDDADGRPSLENLFRGWGFDPVFIPIAIDHRERASQREYVELLDSCHAVWMTGGDQAKHARCLLNDDGTETPMLEAIRGLQARGGFVASGTSAGAAVQPPRIYGGGTSYEYLVGNQLRHSTTPLTSMDDTRGLAGAIGPGIATLPDGVDAVVETHLDRARLGRMVLALREANTRFSIGLSENTGLFLEGTVGTVRGQSGVVVLDAQNATFEADPNGLRVRGLRLHYLSAGDRFDFENGRVLSSKARILAPRKSRHQYFDSYDIFRRHGGQLERVLGELVHSEARWAYGRTAEQDPGFELKFSKASGYVGFAAGDGLDDAFTATGLELDIIPISAG